MKFGKQLVRTLYSPWSSSYLNYKALKKAIKSLLAAREEERKSSPRTYRSQEEEHVCALINAEANKVNSHYLAVLVECKEEFRQLQKIPADLGSEAVDKYDKLCEKLDRLRGFVSLNHLGFQKILKKIDKKLSLSLKVKLLRDVEKKDFYKSKDLSDLIISAGCKASDLHGDPRRRDYLCAICLDLPSKPVVLTCAHPFCHNCLKNAFHLKHNQCPVCRKEQTLDPKDYEVNKVLQSFIARHFPTFRPYTPEKVDSTKHPSTPPTPYSALTSVISPLTCGVSTFGGESMPNLELEKPFGESIDDLGKAPSWDALGFEDVGCKLSLDNDDLKKQTTYDLLFADESISDPFELPGMMNNIMKMDLRVPADQRVEKQELPPQQFLEKSTADVPVSLSPLCIPKTFVDENSIAKVSPPQHSTDSSFAVSAHEVELPISASLLASRTLLSQMISSPKHSPRSMTKIEVDGGKEENYMATTVQATPMSASELARSEERNQVHTSSPQHFSVLPPRQQQRRQQQNQQQQQSFVIDGAICAPQQQSGISHHMDVSPQTNNLCVNQPHFFHSAPPAPLPKKYRVACVHCYKSKTSCDGYRPCSRCIRLNKAETCKDRQQKKRGRPRKPAAGNVTSARKKTNTTNHAPKTIIKLQCTIEKAEPLGDDDQFEAQATGGQLVRHTDSPLGVPISPRAAAENASACPSTNDQIGGTALNSSNDAVTIQQEDNQNVLGFIQKRKQLLAMRERYMKELQQYERDLISNSNSPY